MTNTDKKADERESCERGALASHLTTLDGLRGVAAVAVVFTHATSFLRPLAAPAGSLAVDLFFMLSGYVLCHAYGKRIRDGLPPTQFLQLRLVRLGPLYILGAVFGSIQLALAGRAAFFEHGRVEEAAALISLWTCLPSPLPNRWGEVFAINGPRWSLFFELIANVAMVFLVRRLRSTAWLAAVSISLGVLFIGAILTHRSIEFGWSADGFLLGFVRSGGSFFVGVLLRTMVPPNDRPGILGYVVPFSIVPLLFLPTTDHRSTTLLAILVAFPAIIIAGARASAPRSSLNRFMGAFSYPLYIVHVPLFGLAAVALHAAGTTPEALAPGVGLLLLACLISLSWLLARYYDLPARALLSRALASGQGRRRSTAADALRP